MDWQRAQLHGMLTGLGRKKTIIYCAGIGSRIYGTASPASDYDFGLIVAGQEVLRDLMRSGPINIVIMSEGAFQDGLHRHNIFALELLFAPTSAVVMGSSKNFPYRANSKGVIEAARVKSDEDWQKALRLMIRGEDKARIRKQLFHSVRVLQFALQVATRGCISDYSAAHDVWDELGATESQGEWLELAERRRDMILQQLSLF